MNIVEEQVEAFIVFKQGLGVQMISEAATLRHLGRYAEAVGHEGPITTDLAISWARNGNHHAEGYEIKKYELARRVSEYSSVFDGSVPRLPAGILGKVDDRITPYIYTDEEVSLLMKAASALFSESDLLRPIAYEMTIGLMRSTGMRPSEVLSLKDEDFDSDNLLIVIRKAKNNKERLVPIDESVRRALVAYRAKREQLRNGKNCRSLIVSNGDKPLALHSFQDAFCEIRYVLLDRGEVWQRRPPRPYDLRHTYSVKTILAWYENGEDINALLPVLATYLGHTTISETYWYLTGAPELMEVACSAFESIAKGR
jgi:integrase